MRRNRGITLIALVITIIILLILAGVAISMLSGENGILKTATKGSEETKRASTDEQVKLAVMSALTVGKGSVEGEEAYAALNEGLKNAGYTGDDIKKLPVTITVNGIDYVISEKGEIREPTTEERIELAVKSALSIGGENIEGEDAYKALNEGLKKAGYRR